MKWLSYTVEGRHSFGFYEGEQVHDIGLNSRCDLRQAISDGSARSSGSPETRFSLDEISFLPPIPNPDKIVCIGRNYGAHVAEAGLKPPPFPSLFLRLTNTLVPHRGNLVRPKISSSFDYEGELAIVIGNGGRHIPRERALEHVFGYSIFNDASLRDYQFDHSLAVGKNFHATGGFGPWIATADEIADVGDLRLQTRLNDEIVQDASTAELLFDVAGIISYVSAFTPLVAGDVIATGSPEGVGFARKPPLWLTPGDQVAVEISGIGILQNAVVDEPS